VLLEALRAGGKGLADLVVADSPDGVLAFDRECRYTVWNAAMERLSGVPAADAIGRRAFELFPFLVETGEDRCFREVLAGRPASSFDRPFVIPETGRSGFYEARYAPLHGAGGAVIGGVGIIRDVAGIVRHVTEHVRAERDAAASHARAERALKLQALVLERMGKGVTVANEYGTIVYTNPTADRMFGYGPGELAGRHLTVLTTHPARENALIAAEVVDRLRADGYWQGEWRNVKKDGTAFVTETRITTLDVEGRPHWFCVQEDVTERRRAASRKTFLEEATRILSESLDSHQTLQALTRHCLPFLADYCSVDVLTDRGEIRRIETAHIDPEKEQILRDLWTRYPYRATDRVGVPEVLRTRAPVLSPAFGGDGVDAFARDDDQLAMLRHLGPRSYICVPLVARDRAYGAISLVMSDSGRRYTQRDLELAVELARRAATAVDNARLFREARAAHAAAESARAAAEDANRAKSEFLALMSHELRTPLNAIGGYAELIELGLRGPVTPEQREDLQRIQSSQKHLLGLINEVLSYARIESGAVGYHLTDVPVAEVTRAAETLVTPQLRAKGLVLEPSQCDPENLTARADREKLQQVLLNLLSNSIKFTERGGRIQLRSKAADDRVQIQVCDTGIGIPAEKIESIFEPFVQIGRALNRPLEGTGLGLAISRDLARGMGGDLTAESTIGEGSTITLTLPRQSRATTL
jgi:PAS domain S-box-containing protein